jgi:hypothetical protein
VGIYVDGEAVTNGVTPHTLSDFNTDIEIVVSSVTGFSAGDAVTDTTNGGTGIIYDIDVAGLKIYIKNSEGEFDTGSGNLSNVSVTADISSVSEYHAFFAFWNGFLSYDDTKALNDPSGIVTLPYIANSESNNIRLNLRQTSGLPDLTQFVDTRAVEITEHDNDGDAHVGSCLHLAGDNSPVADIDWDNNKITNLAPATAADDAVPYTQLMDEIGNHDVLATSHNTTHIRLDGANSPTADIDWDDNKITNIATAVEKEDATNVGHLSTISGEIVNIADYTDWVNWETSRPLAINHTVQINLTSNDPSFASNFLTITNVAGCGSIRIIGFPTTVQGFIFTDVNCTIQIFGGITCNALGVGNGIDATRCKLVQLAAALDTINFTNCVNIIDANRSVITLDGSASDMYILAGNTNGFLSSYTSTITIKNVKQSNPTFITGTLYKATENSKIYKPIDMIGNTLIPRTSAGIFESKLSGGEIIGYFTQNGEVELNTVYDIDIDGNSDVDALNDWLKTFGTYLSKNFNLRIRFLDTDPFPLSIPRTFTLTGTIEIEGFEGPGFLTIETQNGDYQNMLITYDSICFDIKNCKSKIKFNDLTVTSTGTASTDDAIKVTNCDNFEVDAVDTAGKLEITAEEGSCIKFDQCRTIFARNLNLTKTDATQPCLDVINCSHANFLAPNFSTSGYYIVTYYTRCMITNGTDVGSPVSASKKFWAYSGSDMNISGTFEVGSGSTQDIGTITWCDTNSVIRSTNDSDGNSVISINQKSVTLT